MLLIDVIDLNIQQISDFYNPLNNKKYFNIFKLL